MNQIEEKRNKLNLEIRSLMAVIGMIDGTDVVYDDYKENSLTEEQFLDQQIKIVEDGKNRLVNVFKD